MYQLEDNELAADPLPSPDDRRVILLYESAEGGAGVLRQLLDSPDALAEMAREALRLAFIQHKLLAVGLKGVQQERTISDTFEQTESGATLVNMMDLDILVGSGGVLSHAPRRVQAAFTP